MSTLLLFVPLFCKYWLHPWGATYHQKACSEYDVDLNMHDVYFFKKQICWHFDILVHIEQAQDAEILN